ncbi:MAG: DUF4124 domain-containing protein [Saccharospirillum sp.]
MKRALLIAAALLYAATAIATGRIYTWTDEEGTVHFGDRPPQNVQADEVNIRGRRTAPVEVNEAQLPGVWFGRQDDGGEVRISFQANGGIRYTQTFPDQSIYNYQGIWQLEDRSLSVITEFIEEGGGGEFNRTVEPVQLSYTFTQFNDEQMTLLTGSDSYVLRRTGN